MDLTKFTLELTQQCNFRCSYCIFSGLYKNHRQHLERKMELATLKKSIEFIVANSHPLDLIHISFYGGEALLESDSLFFSVNQLRHAFGDRVSFVISTNGYLLKDKMIKRICEIPNLKVAVSLDGFQSLHDKNRRLGNGGPTWDVVYGNLKYFRETYPHEYAQRMAFLITVASWKQLLLISKLWSLDPLLADTMPVHVSFLLPREGYPLQVDEDKRMVLDQALDDIRLGRRTILACYVDYKTKMTEHSYFSKIPKNESEIEVKTCIDHPSQLFINAEGKLYMCEKFQPELSVGNIHEGIDTFKIKQLASEYTARKYLLCSCCPAYNNCPICPSMLNYSFEMHQELCKHEQENYYLFREYRLKIAKIKRKLNSIHK